LKKLSTKAHSAGEDRLSLYEICAAARMSHIRGGAVQPWDRGKWSHTAPREDDARRGCDTRVTRSRNMRMGEVHENRRSPYFLPKPVPACISCHPQDQCAGISRVLAISAELPVTECVQAPELILQAVRDSSVARRA
jgi:hypothetical protein